MCLPKNNIVLIGCMGSGKTAVGLCLAKRLGWTLIDTDDWIARKTGRPVQAIFSSDGEDYFRMLEEECLKTLIGDNIDTTVIATGGGMPLKETNRQMIGYLGKVVYLGASVRVIWQRVADDKTRPLLQRPEPRHTLQDLLHERESIYREMADLIIDTDEMTVEQVVDVLAR
jgi:shikimate kinase